MVQSRRIVREGGPALDLQDVSDPTFPDDRKGDVYVTEPDPAGRRTCCIQLDAGTNDMWTHSGLAPARWDPPSNYALPVCPVC